jgi:sugar phosphate isomerase/epimerase
VLSLSVSPCSNPDLSLEQAVAAYVGAGYRRMELFTSWTAARVDPDGDPAEVLEVARAWGMSFGSLHLPVIERDTAEEVNRAVAALKFAAALGCRVALFKAASRELYVHAGRRFLDAADGIPVTPVLQNHFGTPITTLEDYAQVLEGLNDARMGCTLEVGHFHSAGVDWEEAYEFLGRRIALVHVKDQVGRRSVPFGAGEIDLKGLMRRLVTDGYTGDVVVEMENADKENTLRYLGQAREYLEAAIREA